MIIFLYGQNSYSLIQYVNGLISRYQKKYPDSFNLHRFDLEEDDPAQIKNAIKESSFFKQVKFVVVKNPFAKPAFIEKELKENQIGGQKETVMLLYQNGTEKDLKERGQKLFELLKKEAQLKEFKPPTSQQVNKFVISHLAEHKVEAKKGVLTRLIKETGSDLWRLKNELDKIIYFAKKEKKRNIEEEDLVKLVNFKIERNIFIIIDSPFLNQAKALLLLQDYLTNVVDQL